MSDKGFPIKDLILTFEDIKGIIDKRILETFYTMYKGLMQSYTYNDDANRINSLKTNYMLVLKAFYIPPTILSDIPSSEQTFESVYKSASNNNDWWKKTNYENAYVKTLTQIRKFNGVRKEKFGSQLYALGFSRRFEVLTEYFQLDNEIILSSLFYIQHYNNEYLTNARTRQQQQQSVQEQSTQSEKQEEKPDDSKSKSFETLFNYV